VKILWTETALRHLDGVPRIAAEQVLAKLETASRYAHMYPVRMRGRYRGYRWLAAGPWLAFYEVLGEALVVRGILHGARRGA
jgi:hypothetical protein